MDKVSDYLLKCGFIMTEDAIVESSLDCDPKLGIDILKICKAYLEDYKDIELIEGTGREVGNGYKCVGVKLPPLEKSFCEQLVNTYNEKTNGVTHSTLTPVIVNMIYDDLLPKYISSSKNKEEVINIREFTEAHKLCKVWVSGSWKHTYSIYFITNDGYYGYMSVGGDSDVVYKYNPNSLEWDEHKYGGINFMYVF